MPKATIDWTDEKIKAVEDGINNGMSMKAIAASLGGGATRNAVSGLVFRLRKGRGRGAVKRKTTVPSADKKKKNRKSKIAAAHSSRRLAPVYYEQEVFTQLDAPDPLMNEDGSPLTILNKPRGGCMYAHGDIRTNDLHFCGHPTVERGSGVWCEYHVSKVYQVPRPRRVESRVDYRNNYTSKQPPQ